MENRLNEHICFSCEFCFASSGDSIGGMGSFTNYFCSKYDCGADPFPEILTVCEGYKEIK